MPLLPMRIEFKRSAGALVLAAVAALSLPVDAQRRPGTSQPAIPDYASTGMRPTSLFRFFVSNAGPMDVQQGLIGAAPARVSRAGTLITQFTEVTLFASAAPGDWERNKSLAPSLANATGGGAALSFNYHFASPGVTHWLPADASLGFSHSGARSTPSTDASCLNHTGAGLPASQYLMAGSDCPQTWGANGWEGRYPVPQASYQTIFNANRDQFRFDFFRVPQELTNQTAYLGDRFATFGTINDYARERRRVFGSVVPNQTGEPQAEGYPLGLEWQFDAFSFNALPGVVFWQATVTNRTRSLYGVPLDYDSLYAGVLARHGRPAVRARAGFDIARGTAVFNENGHNNTCDNALPVPGVFSFGGYTGGCPSVVGFLQGASAIAMLKSPIGDLRYKLFTQPTSPFYHPTSPVAGDTITYNIGRMCGDDCIQERFLRAGTGFGVLAAREALALGGDSPSALEPFSYWHLFHPENGAPYGFGPRVDLSNPRAGGGFNFAVPAGWRYSSRPSSAPATGSDTLFLDTCNPISNTCVGHWLDTLPDRSINFTRNGTWVGAGPFRLAADSSAALVLAIVVAPDSGSLERNLNDAISLYQSFFVAPIPPPPPRVVATRITGGSRRFTLVEITLDNRLIGYDDQYLRLLATRYRTAAPNTVEGRLQAVNRLGPLNRTIADTLDILALNNVTQILVYKSCDGGRNFTTSNSPNVCTRDVIRDTLGRDLGPAAYRSLAPNTLTFIDGNVFAGQSYYYAFVPVSRGVRLQLRDSLSATNQRIFDTTLVASTSAIPTIASAPNVAVAYIPASQQAGSEPARAELVREAGLLTTVDRRPGTTIDTTWNGVTIQLLDTIPEAERIRVVFGDTVVIREYATTGVVDSTMVTIRRNVTTGYTMAPGRTLLTAYAIPRRARLDTLLVVSRTRASLPLFFTPASTVTTTTTAVGSQTLRTLTVIGATATPGFVTSVAGSPVVQPTGVAVIIEDDESKPTLVTNVLTSSLVSPTMLRHPDFKDFYVNIINRPVVINGTAAVAGGAQLVEKYFVDPRVGRIIQAANSARPTLDWQQSPSRLIGTSFGDLVFEWGAGEFGPQAPFTYQSYGQLQADFNSSMAGRASVTTTVNSAEVVDAINRTLGTAFTPESLLTVALPFRAYNHSNADAPLLVAMRRADKYPSFRLGTGADTIRLNVPETQWLPGEPLMLLERIKVGVAAGGGQAQKDASGNPVTTDSLAVIATRAIIGCTTAAPFTCNPLIGRGGTGHISYTPGLELRVRYAVPHQSPREYVFDVRPTTAGARITRVTQAQLDSVKVVPNPYILYSNFEQSPTAEQRIMFTHLPPSGRIRIFTAAGQFVQQLSWTQQDLRGTGDLYYNMLTREGTLLASGLYLFTVTATGPNMVKREQVGRFVVIR